MLGLVLGGGAAKGYAHIGFIKFLEEEGIRPQLIVGASMGALIGGFLAAGFSARQMAEIACKIDRKKKHWLFRPTISRYGIVPGNNIEKFLGEYLKNIRIEELPVKYAAVATDIENNQEVIINRGSLLKAIRASISIPVVLIPYIYAGQILVDGGFVNPVPVQVAQKLGAEKVIAVDVLPMIEYESRLFQDFSQGIKNFNMKKVFEKTFNLITSKLIEYAKLQLKNGIFIDIDTKGVAISDFDKAKIAIEKGYTEAKRYRGKIIKFLNT